MVSLIFDVTFHLLLLEHFIGGIYWEMKTNPAHFGQNVELLCHEKYNRSIDGIQDTPQKQWFGGVNYSLLCTDSVSSNDKKFVCKYGRTDDYDFSVLTIKNFSTRDVNIPYKCLFGFSSSDLILELSETKFEYQPIESLPTPVTVHSCTNIDLKFRFAKVFPEPICNGKYGLKNITNEIQVDSMIFEKLYRSDIRMTLNNVVDIEGNSIQLLSIKCIIGGHEHTLVSQHISCRDKDIDNVHTTGFIAIAVFIVILLIAAVGYVLKKKLSSLQNQSE